MKILKKVSITRPHFRMLCRCPPAPEAAAFFLE
jgi:hypothetical protein